MVDKSKKKRKKRKRIYDHDVFVALKRIWTIFDFICGKRLAPFMAEAVDKLEKHKEIDITPQDKREAKKDIGLYHRPVAKDSKRGLEI